MSCHVCSCRDHRHPLPIFLGGTLTAGFLAPLNRCTSNIKALLVIKCMFIYIYVFINLSQDEGLSEIIGF